MRTRILSECRLEAPAGTMTMCENVVDSQLATSGEWHA